VARAASAWKLITAHALSHLLVLQLLAAGLVLGLQVQAHPTGSLALCTPSLAQTQADPDTNTDEGLARWCSLACALVGLTGFSPPPGARRGACGPRAHRRPRAPAPQPDLAVADRQCLQCPSATCRGLIRCHRQPPVRLHNPKPDASAPVPPTGTLTASGR